MLSKEDILKELGKNIYVYPLNYSQIQYSSVDFTISKYCWSSNSKKAAYDPERKVVTIAPNDVVVAYTQEAIYLSGRIAGICTSLVSNCKMGINPISTNIDPNYIGFLLIVLHNVTSLPIELKVGDPIVTIQFMYLNTPVYAQSSDITPSHDGLLRQSFSGDPLLEEFIEYCRTNKWSKGQEEMITEYQKPELKESLKKYIAVQRHSFSVWYKICSSKIMRYLFLVILLLVTFIGVEWITSFLSINSPDLVAAVVSVILTIIANDIIKEK